MDQTQTHPTQATQGGGITTEDAFVADRQMFWSSFTGFTTGAVIVVVTILVLLLVFVVF
jgi:hypothetical protein